MHALAQTMGWVVMAYAHPDELPDEVRGDSQTAALVMGHHFGRDLAALTRVLALGLPYIGLLGPRKRHRQMVAELYARQAPEAEALATIHAPAGLDLGSEAPEEIALSIVSEVAAVLAGRHGGHLRERSAPIHLAAEAVA